MGERKVEDQEWDEAAEGRRKSMEQVVFWKSHFKAVFSNLSELGIHARAICQMWFNGHSLAGL